MSVEGIFLLDLLSWFARIVSKSACLDLLSWFARKVSKSAWLDLLSWFARKVSKSACLDLLFFAEKHRKISKFTFRVADFLLNPFLGSMFDIFLDFSMFLCILFLVSILMATKTDFSWILITFLDHC